MFLALLVHCDKTPALLTNLILQWIEVRWIGATHRWRCESRQFDLV